MDKGSVKLALSISRLSSPVWKSRVVEAGRADRNQRDRAFVPADCAAAKPNHMSRQRCKYAYRNRLGSWWI